MNKQKLSSNNGFTLVEMAIVLVIVGLLVGLGSGMITPLTNMAKLRETREIIDSDMTSIVGWSASNNRLPDVAAFQAYTKRTTDSWSRPVIYVYDNRLNTPATKDTICGRRTTALTLRQCLTGNCSTTAGTDYIDTLNIAYIILSQADDGTTQTNIGGTLVTSSSLTLSSTVRVPVGADDVVRWITLDELRSKIGCQGAQLKILNNELPFTNYSALYGPINITADGGTRSGNYEWRIKVPPTLPKPSSLTFTPNLPFANASTSNWVSGVATAPLKIGGFPRPAGSFNYTVNVRDNDGNTAQKSFVLTINPK